MYVCWYCRHIKCNLIESVFLSLIQLTIRFIKSCQNLHFGKWISAVWKLQNFCLYLIFIRLGSNNFFFNFSIFWIVLIVLMCPDNPDWKTYPSHTFETNISIIRQLPHEPPYSSVCRFVRVAWFVCLCVGLKKTVESEHFLCNHFLTMVVCS